MAQEFPTDLFSYQKDSRSFVGELSEVHIDGDTDENEIVLVSEHTGNKEIFVIDRHEYDRYEEELVAVHFKSKKPGLNLTITLFND